MLLKARMHIALPNVSILEMRLIFGQTQILDCLHKAGTEGHEISESVDKGVNRGSFAAAVKQIRDKTKCPVENA